MRLACHWTGPARLGRLPLGSGPQARRQGCLHPMVDLPSKILCRPAGARRVPHFVENWADGHVLSLETWGPQASETV